ncbi:hypothetical protein V1517DRAFT_332637 [Lipomyces orientalis]|uniref:Uncharacterized protein n=1 Tax=Lipomyces orientalis TaxID=1233043 RepID=A0ACC3TE41_9ASCO
MPDSSSSISQPSRPAVRVSLACVACRTKHVRCDAVLPTCSRCRVEEKQCVYLKSRRGGRRRSRTASMANGAAARSENGPLGTLSAEQSLSSYEDDRIDSESSGARTSSHNDEFGDPISEQLLSLYYAFYHAAHPCVLPPRAMKRHLLNDSEAIQPLHAVMQYIGSLFTASVSSAPWKAKAQESLAAMRHQHPAITGYDVQAVLLYSIAVYWCDESEKGLELLDETIRMALSIGMNRSVFAVEHGRQDPVLEESWRRTWWQIYITDAHIAGSTRAYPFRTSRVEMDVQLPCEEKSYETGQIPRPRTLQEYDMREFMDDDGQEFSSFAELVGLTRSLDLALAPRRNLDFDTTTAVCANVDASVTAWTSLLPASKKDIVRQDGSFDEVLFKANAIIHTYTVDLHRQLSTLAYSPIEAVAHCAPPAPPESLRGCNTPECKLHTSKVLRAIERLDALLTLPTNIATHTPFMICMIANTAIAHLAACRYVYRGQQLQLGRERIRLSMGVLKTLSEYWPMGKRTYQEVGIIARETLSLEDPSRPQETLIQEVDVLQPMTIPVELPPPPALLVSDNSLDFCDLFDLNFHEGLDSMPAISA